MVCLTILYLLITGIGSVCSNYEFCWIGKCPWCSKSSCTWFYKHNSVYKIHSWMHGKNDARWKVHCSFFLSLIFSLLTSPHFFPVFLSFLPLFPSRFPFSLLFSMGHWEPSGWGGGVKSVAGCLLSSLSIIYDKFCVLHREIMPPWEVP